MEDPASESGLTAELDEYLPLNSEDRQKITSTRVMVVQDNYWLKAQESGPGMGIAELLSESQLGEDLMVQLSAQLWPIQWLWLAGLEQRSADDFRLDEFLGSSQTSHFLLVRLDFCFSPDFSEVQVAGVNTLYHLNEEQVVYHNRLVYRAAAPGPEEKSSGFYIDQWLDSHAESLFSTFQEGLIEVARMTTFDLKSAEESSDQARGEEIRELRGTQTSQNGDRNWFRVSSGEIFSLPEGKDAGQGNPCGD